MSAAFEMTGVALRREDEISAALAAYFTRESGHPHDVSDVRKLAGGVSHETWSFETRREGHDTEHLILRLDLGDEVLNADTGREFDLLDHMHRRGIPVARPVSRGRLDQLGAGFMISERLDGTDLRKVVARGDHRDIEARDVVRLLAGIHATDTDGVPFAGDPVGSLKTYVEHWLDMVRGRKDALPILSIAAAWLTRHRRDDIDRVVVHGDFKANNIVIADGRPFVLDWELAHLGDPAEDLAWTLLWTTTHDLVGGLMTRENFLEVYAEESGTSVSPERLLYWEIFALAKLAAIFAIQGETLAVTQGSPTLHLMGRAIPYLEHRLAGALARTVVGNNP